MSIYGIMMFIIFDIPVGDIHPDVFRKFVI